MNTIELTREQKEIMTDFYSIKPTKVIFDKKERNLLWEEATRRSTSIDFSFINSKCPALGHQIEKSYQTGNNIQSAVFSECAYAQTFANMMGLSMFVNCSIEYNFIPESIENLLTSYHLVPRYVYSTPDKRKMLIQAGGCDGIDSALITVIDLVIYTIEFKEPGAKTSEPDLPKYGEDGNLVVTNDWIEKNPQFRQMLDEQKNLNFFEVMGSNVNNFSKESIDVAVSSNYTGRKKFADVIVTEDSNGFLVMLPTNQVSSWAEIEGEIRPAGRNSYKVWTPFALRRMLKEKGAEINDSTVFISKSELELRKERGGNGRVSGYKINPIFYVRVEDCKETSDHIIFDIKKVWQLKPTITGKMFFKELKHNEIKLFYKL